MTYDKDCLFCKIVAGEIPCAKIYETDEFLGFLDIQPVNKGHALIIPKAHYPTILEMPDELGSGLVAAARAIGGAVLAATGADGFNLWGNTYEAAGQLIFHVHFHIVPRFKDDGLKLWPQKPYDSNDEMNALAAEISRRIG